GIKRSVSPVSDTPVKRLAAYPALPTEVILQIADHLSLEDAKRKIEAWRQYYNEARPHSALQWMTPAEFACQ
ncbi:transposase, partial [Mycetohabitans sp. B6]|uniref:transposase n=1 Tax=Mycetohabitans sp. B6 TaxID=2841843 RepID=UPI001F1DF2E4